jgi:hypothetical protein
LYHTVIRAIGRTLLTQSNLVEARPVQAADVRITAVVLATLSRQSNARHPLALIPGASITTSRISSSTSGVADLGRLLLATRGSEFLDTFLGTNDELSQY